MHEIHIAQIHVFLHNIHIHFHTCYTLSKIQQITHWHTSVYSTGTHSTFAWVIRYGLSLKVDTCLGEVPCVVLSVLVRCSMVQVGTVSLAFCFCWRGPEVSLHVWRGLFRTVNCVCMAGWRGRQLTANTVKLLSSTLLWGPALSFTISKKESMTQFLAVGIFFVSSVSFYAIGVIVQLQCQTPCEILPASHLDRPRSVHLSKFKTLAEFSTFHLWHMEARI